MRKRAFFTFLIILLFVCQAFATAQYPDKILYEGKEYALHSNPLEEYFQKFPEKKPKNELTYSSLWRGYVATFEINKSALYLKDVQIMVRKDTKDNSYATDWKSVLTDVVPEKTPLKIDWFSGLLVLPFGEMVNYVHMGYASTYENYIVLEIDKGDFKKAKRLTYKEYEKFKKRQFMAFKKTPEYRKIVKDLKKNGNRDDKSVESFLRNAVISYSSKILVD